MYRTFSRPFCPNLRFCVAGVDMLGLWTWSVDLNVILFEFLDDDTKLAQSCRNWLYVVPEPSMRQCTTAVFVNCVTQFFSLPNFCGCFSVQTPSVSVFSVVRLSCGIV